MAGKNAIIEFDFAAMDGAGLLFTTAKNFLEKLDGIPLDVVSESRYLSGNSYLNGFSSLFSVVKTKKTAQKAAKDINVAFNAALTAALPSSVTAAFRNFVQALSEKGIKVVIATRADPAVAQAVFAPILGETVSLFREESTCYGSVKWDSWRRICLMTGLGRSSTIAIAGSGFSVKSALIAGIGAIAVAGERVAYQDFTGADVVLGELSGKTAKKALSVLRVS